MKYGVIIYDKSRNYGDDIQTIAASRLLSSVDYYLDRESLDNPITNEKIKLICNGWFMDNPENWPPANNIDPLFISFHISHSSKSDEYLLSKKYYNYYKKHEPIGCRDYHTVELFKQIGIKAYFSGCLTLTLENQFKDIDRNNEIIFTDLPNDSISADMYKTIVKKLVPNSLQKHIVYKNHYHSKVINNIDRLQTAEQLIESYSKAHLVITSRIHVALPCIALGTPILFLDIGYNSIDKRNRFGGLIEYFNTIDQNLLPFTSNNKLSILYRNIKLYKIGYFTRFRGFNWDNPPKPSNDFINLSNNIKEKISTFIAE